MITDIPAATLGENPWEFASAEIRALFDGIRAAHPTQLQDVAEIFVGVQTSADDIYILRAPSETPTTVTFSMEEQHLDHRKGDPKTLSSRRWIQPAEMRRDFPGAFAYLSARRAELDQRNVVGGTRATRQFYQFGRSQSLTKFNSDKIILPALSVELRYAYDDSNVVVTGGGNGPYYLLRPRDDSGLTNFYLLAILNHPLSEAFVRTNTSPFRGGYYSHGRQFIEHLPVPIPREPERAAIEALVRDLLTAHDNLAAARTPHLQDVQRTRITELRRQVDLRISAIFGLTPADLEIVLAVPIPA